MHTWPENAILPFSSLCFYILLINREYMPFVMICGNNYKHARSTFFFPWRKSCAKQHGIKQGLSNPSISSRIYYAYSARPKTPLHICLQQICVLIAFHPCVGFSAGLSTKTGKCSGVHLFSSTHALLRVLLCPHLPSWRVKKKHGPKVHFAKYLGIIVDDSIVGLPNSGSFFEYWIWWPTEHTEN